MNQLVQDLDKGIAAYKNKYYKNILLKGSCLAAICLISAFLLFTTIEYFGNLNQIIRAALFYGFLGIGLFSLVFWVLKPIMILMNKNWQFSHESAAQQIGRSFPEISDKLLNVLQMQQIKFGSKELLQAGINQKAGQMVHINFADAIRYENNRRYFGYFIVLLGLAIGIGLLVPSLFSESTERIINYDQAYAPKAPFVFKLQNTSLKTFRNEDFEIKLKLEGSALPSEVFLVTNNGRKIKMEAKSLGNYSYTFTQVQKTFDFTFEAVGFVSVQHQVQVLERPNLSNFTVYLSYPRYVGKKDERVENTGNLVIPAGTTVSWNFKTSESRSLSLFFESDSQNLAAQKQEDQLFELKKRFVNSTAYKIKLENEHSQNKEDIRYFLNVTPDEYPSVTLAQYKDSVLHNYLMLDGSISDDYGISRLQLKYRVWSETDSKEGKQPEYKVINLSHNAAAINQKYYHQLDIQSLNLKPGDRLSYFVQVWDNDGVNGAKSTKTTELEYKIPDQQALNNEIDKAANDAEKNIDKALEKTKELQKNLEEMQDKLKGKNAMSFQDKKALEKFIKQHKELQKQVEDLSKQNEQLNSKQERFDPKSEELAEKTKQLQKLMEEVMDDETKKMLEKLEELLQEKAAEDKIKEQLDKMQDKNKNLEKDLDRALEMFKQLQFENKLEDIIKQLQDLSKEQDKLAEDTKDAPKEDANKNEELKKEQEQLNKEFKNLKKEMEELKKMNEELENKKEMEDTKEDEQSIQQEQQKSSENLNQKQNNQASKSQKSAAQKMQKMAQKMENMKTESMEAEATENYEDLRQILENLLTASFEQEKIMKGFKGIDQKNPQFLDFSQRQLKLKDDVKIIEDSLRSLAKRVFQIESFVTRELADMNGYMDQATDAIKKRRPDLAAGKQQQSMTSMNNLALLLNDVLKQMQAQMAANMPGQQSCSKPGKGKGMGQMQQEIGQQIQELMKSGKSGKGMSEQLAKILAQQEQLRRMLEKENGKKAGKQPGKDGKGEKNGQNDGGENGKGGNLSKMIEQMEKTEEDLANKRLTRELVERQKEILTRLLEHEKAQKERGFEEKREAEQAKEKEKNPPKEYLEYLKEKEKQIELLKTIPASLVPYYKQEVNEYFKKLNEGK
ncbi:MAG: DUF4175 family protein [Cytophagales bacterium]|nr:MAG: DUF4175 family protein [Cytophagales bacterium]